jgi:hypothetical protein
MTKSSKLLRRAKDCLWDGLGDKSRLPIKTDFICYAIIFANPKYNAMKKADLRVTINSRLAPYHCLERWLIGRANVAPVDLTDENVQAYRHRWLDALIAEYEAKGD